MRTPIIDYEKLELKELTVFNILFNFVDQYVFHTNSLKG
ncbi:hypothetical protein M595_5614 [Lyngbya aestuarii BL J]|uniref:Uncharacterized protein n=1 Tax=Lyngbya aestuarii BL J TaxID=1348334 RepID=U7Q9E8_9CYAN|nr:hypothetical protein M595_5614 [Lyngbya aestuarii BL J]